LKVVTIISPEVPWSWCENFLYTKHAPHEVEKRSRKEAAEQVPWARLLEMAFKETHAID